MTTVDMSNGLSQRNDVYESHGQTAPWYTGHNVHNGTDTTSTDAQPAAIRSSFTVGVCSFSLELYVLSDLRGLTLTLTCCNT